MTSLAELGDTWKEYDVIGIDEGQFYHDVSTIIRTESNPLLKVVEFSDAASQSGKIVIISALSGTYQRGGFNSILDLVPRAEKIVHLKAICKLCFHSAAFTLRTTSANKSLELIGGSEDYMPVCRECYLAKT